MANLAGEINRYEIRSGETRRNPEASEEEASEFRVEITANFTTHQGDLNSEQITLFLQLDFLSNSPAEAHNTVAETLALIGLTNPLIGFEAVTDALLAFCNHMIPRAPPHGSVVHASARVDVLVSHNNIPEVDREVTDITEVDWDVENLNREIFMHLINDVFGEFVPRVGPASEEEIEQLERVKNDDVALTCPICLDDLSVGSEAIRLPCKHVFDEDCIVTWFRRTKTCPLCRSELRN